MVEIKQQFVPEANRGATFGTGNPNTKMVVHQTGNKNRGANAKMHAKLQEGIYVASWHFQSDDKEIIQSWPLTYRLFHASTGGRADGGNMVGIGWEICINEDGDYLKSLDVASKGIAKVMKQVGMPMSGLTTHNAEDRANRKHCPTQILDGKDGVNWAKFVQMVQNELDLLNGKAVVDGATVSKPVASKPVSKPQTEETGGVLNMSGKFVANDKIYVYGQPKVNYPHYIATYQRGETLKYDRAILQNGYVWLEYTRNVGGKGYLPIAPLTDGVWGTLK